MAESIGDLVINLKAETASFTADIARAHGSLKTMAEAAVGLGAAMATGLAAIVASTIEMADKMGKLAQVTGLTTESLSALSFAAKMVDVDQESLAKGLEKLAKNMDKAAQSTGASAFGRLGIAVKDASGHLKDSDVVLAEIADKFAKMPDGAQKTALAMQLFGKSGAQLIPLLDKGSAGIQQFKDEAERLGLVLDDTTRANAEKFEESLKRLKAASEGAALQFTSGLLPTLNNLVDVFTKGEKRVSAFKIAGDLMGKGLQIIANAANSAALAFGLFVLNGEKANNIASKIANVMVPGAGTLIPNSGRSNAEIEAQKTELYKLYGERAAGIRGDLSGPMPSDKDSKKSVGNLTDMAAAAEAAAKEAEALRKSWQSLFDSIAIKTDNPWAKAFAEAADEEKKLEELIRKSPANALLYTSQIAQARLEIHQKLLDDLTKADLAYGKNLLSELSKIGEAERNSALANAISVAKPSPLNGNANPFQVATDNLSKNTPEEQKARAAEAVQVFDQTRKASENYSQQMNKLNILLGKGAIDQTTYNRAVVQARLTMTPFGQVLQGVGNAFGTMFESVVTGTKSLGKAFSAMAQSIIASIAQMIAKMLVLWAVQKLVGIFGGLFGMGTATNVGSGSNPFSSTSVGIGNTATGFGIGSLPHRASGGSVLAGHAYMVGERGPEPFIPGVNGTILPSGSGGRGGDTYIDARGADAGVEQRIMRAMAKAMEATKASTLAAVRDRRLRGATI